MWLSNKLIVFQTDTNILYDILTLIDSEVSNYCFADRSLFTSYISYNLPKMGLFTNKDPTFNIFEKGLVQFLTEVNRIKQKIIFNNILYIPSLHSNLISVLKLILKGVYVKFARKSAIVTILLYYVNSLFWTTILLQTLFSLYLHNQWTNFYKLSCAGKPQMRAICTYMGGIKATTNDWDIRPSVAVKALSANISWIAKRIRIIELALESTYQSISNNIWYVSKR